MFTEDDGLEQVALLTHEDRLCPGCANRLDHTTDDDHPYYWDAVVSPPCAGCEAKDEKLRELAGTDGKAPAGVFVSVVESDERAPDKTAD